MGKNIFGLKKEFRGTFLEAIDLWGFWNGVFLFLFGFDPIFIEFNAKFIETIGFRIEVILSPIGF